jgi:hypothetical protein
MNRQRKKELCEYKYIKFSNCAEDNHCLLSLELEDSRCLLILEVEDNRCLLSPEVDSFYKK